MSVRQGNAPLHYQALTPAGSTQADATAISYESSPGFVVATGNDVAGLRLPAPGKGKQYYVSNLGATGALANLFVYPPTGVQINALGVNTPLTLLPQTAVMFVAGGGQWYTCPVVPS